MKKKDLESLREKTTNVLEGLIDERRREIAKTLAEVGAGREKNLKKAKMQRRQLAQTLTIAREKELIQQISEEKSESIKSDSPRTKESLKKKPK